MRPAILVYNSAIPPVSMHPCYACAVVPADSVDCPVFVNDEIVQQPADLLTLTEQYVTAASTFIKQNASTCTHGIQLPLLYCLFPVLADTSTPFLLYFAFQHTHQPQFASKQFTNTTLRGPFGDSLANLDWGVGEIMAALKQSGVDNNTLVFFTADNGWACTA